MLVDLEGESEMLGNQMIIQVLGEVPAETL